MSSTKRWVDPERTALLLIDFINPSELAQPQEMRSAILSAATMTKRLKRVARRAGIACIYVNDHFDAPQASFDELIELAANANAVSRRVAEQLAPAPGDDVILKDMPSAFDGTQLESVLASHNATRVILTGIATGQSLIAAAQDAYVRRLDVWIPADCVACGTAADQAALLQNMAWSIQARVRKFSGRLA